MKKLAQLLVLLYFTFNQLNASELKLAGNWTYRVNNSSKTVQITGDKISNNTDGGLSGTIKLRLYVTQSKYYGGSLSGYILAECTFDQLKGGYYYYDINKQLDFYSRPAEGTYYVTLCLLEYSDGYYIVDYLNFDGTLTFDYSAERLQAISNALDATNNLLNSINNTNNQNYNSNTNQSNNSGNCYSYQLEYDKQKQYAENDIKRLGNMRDNDKIYGTVGDEYASTPNPALRVATLKSIRSTQDLMRTIRIQAQNKGCYIEKSWQEKWTSQ